ncbi:uncharacterized protein LOC133295794 [Gastrolobium bilobum]|uniref:uncharacterized protein LOC133295794 n=1 Tax=Gastrolobium bilobum TaxID=150636 RepID=UPI002AB21EDE|nr:uncharacterized protein LOC133295794 [Gastrolobium bilobum]
MGHSRLVVMLLVSSLLFLSFGYGFGRVALMETVEHRHSTTGPVEHAVRMRMMFETKDYAEPEPNTNPKNGNIFSPPSPIETPPPRA